MWKKLRRSVRDHVPNALSAKLVAASVAARSRMGAALHRARAGPSGFPRLDDGLYERLYESHAHAMPPESSIGSGDFDLIGRIELGALQSAGLNAASTLVDFGCGTGRLAVHAVPFLAKGRYIGTDISKSMLDMARERVAAVVRQTTCRVEFIKQQPDRFHVAPESADFVCAFSVFTHMEHEDTYRYLVAARKAVRPGGRFVLSCLPISLTVSCDIFLASANIAFSERWQQVRNVATSTELMEAVARLAGWRPVCWYAGDKSQIPMPGTGELRALGQSVLVLEKSLH